MLLFTGQYLRENTKFFFSKNSFLGRVFWISNAVLFYFFVYFILNILLSPFGFLCQFVQGVCAVITVLSAIISYYYNFKWFDFFDNLPLYKNGILFIIMIMIYYFSLDNIWSNKKNYIKYNQQ